MLNRVLVLFYTGFPISIEILSQKIFFELHASKFVICNEEKNFMTPFYECKRLQRLQSYCEETVYFLPLSPKEFLVLIWSTSEGR